MDEITYHINEANIGEGADKEMALELIRRLREDGWHVEYGDSILTPKYDSWYPSQFDVAFQDHLDALLEETE